MRASKRLLGVVALLVGLIPNSASADVPAPSDSIASRAVSLVDHIRDLLRGLRPDHGPLPQANATGGSVLDLSDLSRPIVLENRLRTALRPVGGELRVTVADGMAHRGDFTLPPSETRDGHLLVIEGDAEIRGHLRGNVVTVEGDVVVHPTGVITGDILALGGEVRDNGGEIGGEAQALPSSNILSPLSQTEPPLTPLESLLLRGAGVLGVFLTLLVLGFGLVMFGRQNLEVVSDTVSHSFGRSFVTGLLGQILLLPTFGMMVVGLILSVAGILLLPFAIAVFAMLAVIAIVGGYLAVAHAMGETYTRRRMALGVVIGSPNSYRYLVIGLVALATLWIAWALFGWVPVAGSIIWGAAFFVTWLLGTTGFGAALLSRAGVKESFAGRLLPPEALTDEYLWATPQYGVPAARRPGMRTPSRGA
jgi:hypothetical protein